MTRHARATLVTVALLLASCSHTRDIGGAPGITVLDTQTLPPPAGVDPSDVTRAYRVGPGDELLVDVIGFDSLSNRKFSTDGDGRLSVPLAGVMDVNGLTVAEIETLIGQRMRAGFVRDPIVSVNLSEARSRRVTVDGQVRRPGLYPVVGRMSLMQAVARAEGVAEFARLDDVVVFRTIGDDRYVALYNLQAIRRGAYADPEIYPGDIVVVGESTGRRMFQTLVQAGSVIAGPLIALIQR